MKDIKLFFYCLPIFLSFCLPLQAFEVNIDSLYTVLEEQRTVNPDSAASTIVRIVNEQFYTKPVENIELIKTMNSYIEESDNAQNVGKLCYSLAAFYLMTSEYNKAIEWSEKSIEKSREIEDWFFLAKAYNVRSNAHFYMGNVDTSVTILDTAIYYGKKIDNEPFLASLYVNKGIYAMEATAFDDALTAFFSSLDIYEKENDEALAAAVKMNVGSAYLAIEEYDKSIKYSKECIDQILEDENYYLAVSVYNNLAGCYNGKGDVEEAKKYYLKSIEINENRFARSLSGSYHGLGHVYLNENNLSKAEEYFSKAYNAKKEQKLSVENISTAINLSSLMTNFKRYAESRKYIQEAEALIKETGSIYHEKDMLNSKLFLDLGEKGMFRTEQDLQKLIDILEDERVEEKAKITEELNIKYQTVQKEQENQLLKQHEKIQSVQLSNRNNLLLLSAIGIGILGVLLWLLARQNNAKKSINKQLRNQNRLLEEQKKRITLLNQELSHRVKNNLQLISSLLSLQSRRLQDEGAKAALQESKNRIQAMNAVYQKLYTDGERSSINLYEYLSDLAENMQDTFANEYQNLKIQVNTSHKDIEYDAEQAVRIGLIVNELVTNAVKYAFVEEDKPTIDMNLSQNNVGLVLKIKDNGVGMIENQEKDTSLGTQLIQSLVKQMKGSISRQNNNGLEYILKFNHYVQP